jgi:hypothetical protein
MLTPYQQEVAIKELVERHYWPEPVARQRVLEYAAVEAAVQAAKSRIGPPQYHPAPGMPGPRC